MRLVTKAVLLLSLVAIAVLVIHFAAKKQDDRGDRGAQPRVESIERNAHFIDDHLTRWSERLAATERREDAPAAPQLSVVQELDTSAQDEGTVIAVHTPEPILGADPPGPMLRPEGVRGTVVTERWLAAADDPNRFYVIQAGDTLYDIAVVRYGDPSFVRVIEAANPGLNPRALKIGDRLVLPEKGSDEKQPAAPPKPKVYVVRKNDTLIGIARHFYGDSAMYNKIYEANRDVLPSVNATLYVGQSLRLPEPQ